jgi:hypothetical protein
MNETLYAQVKINLPLAFYQDNSSKELEEFGSEFVDEVYEEVAEQVDQDYGACVSHQINFKGYVVEYEYEISLPTIDVRVYIFKEGE